jgi:hypothetical protein
MVKQGSSALLNLFHTTFGNAVGLWHASRGGSVNQSNLFTDLKKFWRVVSVEARDFVAPCKVKHGLQSVFGRLRRCGVSPEPATKIVEENNGVLHAEWIMVTATRGIVASDKRVGSDTVPEFLRYEMCAFLAIVPNFSLTGCLGYDARFAVRILRVMRQEMG